MAIFDFLSLLLRGSRTTITLAAAEVCQRARDGVWDRVGTQVVGMSRPEAIGYTRSHSLDLVARGVEEVLREQELNARWRAELLDEALQRVTDFVWQRAQQAKQARQRRLAA